MLDGCQNFEELLMLAHFALQQLVIQRFFAQRLRSHISINPIAPRDNLLDRVSVYSKLHPIIFPTRKTFREEFGYMAIIRRWIAAVGFK